MSGISIPGLTINSNPNNQLKAGQTISFGVQPLNGPAQYGKPLPITNTQSSQPTGGGNNNSGGGGSDYNSTLAKMKAGQMTWDDNLLSRLNTSAQSAQDATLAAIQRRLDETRTQAKQQIDNATGTRDYVMDFINKRYPELQGRVEQQRTNELQDLGTQETDLQTLYDRANAQARRRSESAALQNRMSARAGNRLGSSFYDELVANNQEDLGKTLGASDLERIGKVAAIGTQKTRTNQQFDNTLQDLDTQETQAKHQAIDEYSKAVQSADALSRAGVLDFGEGEAQAAQNLQSRLDSIAQWAQGMAQQKMSLDAQYGSGGSFDSTLAGFANANNQFTTNNAATPAGNNLTSYAPTTMNAPQQSNSTNLLGFGPQKPLTLQDILNGLGGGLATA